MGIELYTYEDYIKDFESDYLGFADVLKEPVPEASSENNSEEKNKVTIDSYDIILPVFGWLTEHSF